MSSDLENRIRILEENHEYQDRTVEELNQVIIRQQLQLDSFQEELSKLREDVIATNIDAEVGNDPPPHY